MTFRELKLSDKLLRAVEEKGYTTPTPIQEQAIPPVLAGRDLLGCAQTGTGKTAAFTLPIIQMLDAMPRDKGKREISALVLTPTRELAIQIEECCQEYACHTDIRHTVIFGGVNQKPQVDRLRAGVDLLIATPGRLLDLIGQRHISLASVKFFVLDEADRMLDMGFIHDIRRILPLLPKQRQTLFFSATMPDPILKLSSTILNNPEHVAVTPQASVVEIIAQQVYFAQKDEKADLLIDLLRSSDANAVLVFSRTKHGADRIAKILNKAGIVSSAIHGNKSQNARVRAMNDFKSGECRVLIATDIAARGIDISELPLVINYDLPEVPETYVHRIGRTGRAGCDGTAFSFCSEDERPLLRDIEKIIGMRIPTSQETAAPRPRRQAETSEDRAPRQENQTRRGDSPAPREGGFASRNGRRGSESRGNGRPQGDTPRTNTRTQTSAARTGSQAQGTAAPSHSRHRRSAGRGNGSSEK